MSLAIVSFALVLHVLLDGAVLSLHDQSELLAWAVVAHRLPAGFAIVLAVRSSQRPMIAMWGLSAVMIIATLAGYFAGPMLLASLPELGTAIFEAIVAGVLLHVAFVPHAHTAIDEHAAVATCVHSHHEHAHGHQCDHDEHAHGHDEPSHHHEEHGHHHHDPIHAHAHHSHAAATEPRAWAAAGAIIGLFTMVWASLFDHGMAADEMPSYLQTFAVLVVESAPALLLGYALAGILPFVLTPARTEALGVVET